MSWLYTSSGGTNYVNQGPDRRVGGLVGRVMAGVQRMLSFHSTKPPAVWALWRDAGPGHVALLWPPFLTIALPRQNARYGTFRIGWRWDENWGSGGYIFDVIVKCRMPSERVVRP